MARPIKTRQIPNLKEAIKETAWKQIAEFGASTLSLRSIARDLNITAPAIYNYFPCRDDLVTALIIDAFSDFGDSQIKAFNETPANDLAGQLMTVGVAYRQWALKHPERYHLIFGTPIPGYVAPLEEVMPIAARSLSALISVVDALRTGGKLQVMRELKFNPENLEKFEIWKKVGGEVDTLCFSIAVLIWARVHGLVSLEISNSLPPFGASTETLYQFELDSIVKEFVKE